VKIHPTPPGRFGFESPLLPNRNRVAPSVIFPDDSAFCDSAGLIILQNPFILGPVVN
jgi:hypothetical protein